MKAKPGRRVSSTTSIPAPVGGWNRRDSVAEMAATDAVLFSNWFPLPSDVMVRKGCANWTTGITGTVESLLSYANASASKLFAAAGTAIYDVSSQGAVGAAVVSTLTNAQWYSTNMETSGGQFLYCFNGADKPRLYDGAAWTAIDGASVPAITGVTTTTLVYPHIFKRRLWMVQTGTTKAWYLPVDSVGGAASSFDFGPLFPNGGYLQALGSWTLDAGEGVDDLLVAVSSRGDIVVYKGTDPASSTTWSLVGVWQVGSPLGRRCLVKWGGDLLIICKDGLLPFSKALMSSRVNTKSALTDKIQRAISDDTTNYSAQFGWQCIPFPQENMLVLNVPTSATASKQYAMNSITSAWSGEWTGWNAVCFALHGDELYFGTAGKTCKAWTGNNDAGTNIVADGLPAFNYFKTPGRLKHFKEVRPIISTDGSPGVLLGCNVDFDTTAPSGVPTFTSTTSGLWDSAMWDAGVWGGDLSIKRNWQTIGGIGYCGAAHLKVATANEECHWISTDYVYEVGGVIG